MQRIALLQPHLHRKKWLYSATAPSEIQYIYGYNIFRANRSMFETKLATEYKHYIIQFT